ncbi:histidine kinase [Saccharothrix violaceirubra]|uniref:histidine kinase n=1 Tax=Saccharothrix violaceirubra TaxID=413306 RepID=A0A7W7T7M0_9PSEU|nr:histidine kinase [Saccharothrix violaceirubra]MBB4968031.1 signal transduction histidine kinase [Saccharothrix violaceirubra]
MRRLPRYADLSLPPTLGLLTAGVAATHPAAPPLALAAALTLYYRRNHPIAVTAATLFLGAGIQLLAPRTALPYAALIAVATLTARKPPWVSLPALAATEAVIALNRLTMTTEETVFLMVVAVLPWTFGEVARNRRTAMEEAAKRAVSEEQARIARDLHDVIAHSLAVVVVQALAADDVFDHDPARAREALRAIDSAARATLDDLRTLLADVRPDPRGLSRLTDLVDPLRTAGLRVSVTARHPHLPADVDATAYRIVQEALTNTLRHADATAVDVTVSGDAAELVIEVRDDGRGGVGLGRGITGMKERAGLLGGTVTAGPGTSGGFHVTARLPLAAS